MFQPPIDPNALRGLARDRLVQRIAGRWSPSPRQTQEAQQAELADLVTDVADLLPSRATPDALAVILEAAWTSLRRDHQYATWPKSPVVRKHVAEAVETWRSREGSSAPTEVKLRRPDLPAPDWCQRKAETFRAAGSVVLTEYWERLAQDAAIQWRHYLEQGGAEIDASTVGRAA